MTRADLLTRPRTRPHHHSPPRPSPLRRHPLDLRRFPRAKRWACSRGSTRTPAPPLQAMSPQYPGKEVVRTKERWRGRRWMGEGGGSGGRGKEQGASGGRGQGTSGRLSIFCQFYVIRGWSEVTVGKKLTTANLFDYFNAGIQYNLHGQLQKDRYCTQN